LLVDNTLKKKKKKKKKKVSQLILG